MMIPSDWTKFLEDELIPNLTLYNFMMWVLCTPVQFYIGQRFYKGLFSFPLPFQKKQKNKKKNKIFSLFFFLFVFILTSLFLFQGP